jgi:redox-sensitive bicupin YhaK (pirin superfamily)
VDNQYSVVIFENEGEQIELKSGSEGIEFLLGMGKPLNETNVFGGPFVMSTTDQLLEAKRRFGRGEMGQLSPSVKF